MRIVSMARSRASLRLDLVGVDQAEGDVFPDGEGVEQRAALKQHAEFAHHARADFRRHARDVGAVDEDLAAVGPHDAERAFQRHRFALARAADDHERAALRHIDIDAVEHLAAAKSLLDADELEFRGHAHHSTKNAVMR